MSFIVLHVYAPPPGDYNFLGHKNYIIKFIFVFLVLMMVPCMVSESETALSTRGALMIFIILELLHYQYQSCVCKWIKDACICSHTESVCAPGLQQARIHSTAGLGLLFKSTWGINYFSLHCKDAGALSSTKIVLRDMVYFFCKTN